MARAGDSTWILYNALSKFHDTHILLECPPSASTLIRSRMRRLGPWRVFGQLLFQLLAVPIISMASVGRRQEIIREFCVSVAAPPPGKLSVIPSVNHPESWEAMRLLSPDVIVINGTRILSKSSLQAYSVPVLNTHVGITPRYRGVHGAYWALANKDRQHCGVTVHLVDTGIDTGGILHQAVIHPTAKDNFTTYPTLQMAVGSTLLCKAVEDVINGTVSTIDGYGASTRWYHPTLWEYIRNYFQFGIR